MVSARSRSIIVNPAPSAPGIACTANVATCTSRSSKSNRPVDNRDNAVKLACRSFSSAAVPSSAGTCPGRDGEDIDSPQRNSGD